MKDNHTISRSKKTLESYVTGFGISLFLTVFAYLIVTGHVNSFHTKYAQNLVLGVIVVTALLQFLAQLVFFLHLGRETKPRWNLTVLLYSIVVVLILVFGTIWVMNNLDYHGKTPAQIDTEMFEEEGIKRR